MRVKEDKEKSPVTIRYKVLKNGNQSIYLDCYLGSGQREYKFLNLYLRPGKSKEDREWNKTQMELATAIKSQYIVDIQNGVYGFKDLNRTQKNQPAAILPLKRSRKSSKRHTGQRMMSNRHSSSVASAAFATQIY